MKIKRITLILSAGCAAWLFAQEPMQGPQSSQSAAVPADEAAEPGSPAAETAQPEAAEKMPVVVDESAVVVDDMPAAAQEMPAVAEEGSAAAEEEIPADAEPAADTAEEVVVEVDQIGISDEMDAGSTMSNELVSLSLKDVELQDVVRMFSRLSGVNIIVPDLTQGQGEGQQASKRIDVNLENVEWKPALQAILDTQNLELFEKITGSEVYSIRKKLPPAEAPRTTRTFILNYADINNVATMVKGIVGGQGEVFPYQQGNSIVVKTTQDVMNDVAQVIENVDRPRQQVLIEARIMELSDENRNARGVDIRGFKNVFNQGSQLYQTGFDANNNPVFSAIPNTGNLVFDSIASLTEADFDNTGGLGTLTLSASDMDVTLKALQQSGLARVVSNPRVVVANGETANIQILKKVPRVQITRTIEQTENGPVTVYETDQDTDGTDENTGRTRYAEYEFGIRLAVTPTVYTEDNIAVDIVPIITRQSQSGNIELPVDPSTPDIKNTFFAVDEKRVETQFVLGSERTAVIGGLTETQNKDIERKIPFLGSVPLIRHLFTYKEVEEIQTENIIFVTVALEDGQDFDIENAVSKSPLTRQQMVRDENNQRIQDRQVEILREHDETRVENEIKEAESREQFDSFNRKAQTPLWNFLRP